MVTITHTGKSIEEIEKHLVDARSKVVRVAGVYMRDQFKLNISTRRGMPENGSLRPFRGRELHFARTQGKNPLYNTGKMLNSIRIISITKDKVVVGIDNPQVEQYAEVMQNGGDIIVTKKMKSFFWAKYYEQAGQQVFSVRTKKLAKTKKNNRLSNDAELWRNMALKKVGSKINIEARTFMKITPDIEKGITRIIKNLFEI